VIWSEDLIVSICANLCVPQAWRPMVTWPSLSDRQAVTHLVLTMTTWKAHAECPAHLREQVEQFGNSITPSWRTEPFIGDVFDSSDHAFACVQAYAFLNGFAVVKWRTATKDERARFRCIYHSLNSKNWRELEQRMERDEEGNILLSPRRGEQNHDI
jgi:hypothetical protein